MQRAQTQRDTDERLLFFIQARESILCAKFAGPLQVFAVFMWEALSLFLEHSMAEWGRGDSGWGRVAESVHFLKG